MWKCDESLMLSRINSTMSEIEWDRKWDRDWIQM